MTTATAPSVATRADGILSAGTVTRARPTFFGVLRGELFKLTRQRANWLLLLLTTGMVIAPTIYFVFFSNHAQTLPQLQNPPQLFVYYALTATLAILRVFAGIFLLVATARMIGLEYQNGTIRILLARGVGRLELLGAKLAAMAIVGVGLLVWGGLLDVLGTMLWVQVIAGNLDPINALTSAAWTDVGITALTVAISMGVSILLAASVTVVTRSLSFGLTGALGWFAADNIGVLFLFLVYRVTQSDFWINLTGYLLGPELNTMPATVVPGLVITGTAPTGQVVSHAVQPITMGIPPMVTYDGAHALVTVAVYALVFAVAAVVVMARRDVLE